MESSPLFRTATDFREIGFAFGVITLLLSPFLLKTLDLSTPKLILVKTVVLIAFLAFVPISIVFVLLNYCEYIPSTTPLAGVGPFLFIVSLAIFPKLLINWKHLSRAIRLIFRFDAVALLVVLASCLTSIEPFGGREFDMGLLVGNMWGVSSCLPPPGFEEKDLVGNWTAYGLGENSDRLLISDDGLYKQIIHVEYPAYDYQSEWLPWRIEKAENGVVYLHLTGWNTYGFAPHRISADVIGSNGVFLDFCQPRSPVIRKPVLQVGVRMPPGEMVFTVRNAPVPFVQPPRGINLSVDLTDISGWTYELEHE